MLVVITALCSLLPALLLAQVDTAWVRRYNGPGNGTDEAFAIAVDTQGNVYVTGECGVAPRDYGTVKYVQTGAIEENHEPLSAERLSLEVFPNPASSFFVVRGPSSVKSIKIFDISGKEVKRVGGLGNGDWRISLDGIKNGIYFIKINHNNQVSKLIVTK